MIIEGSEAFPSEIRCNTEKHFLYGGLEVFKWGRTTGITEGRISEDKATVTMSHLVEGKGTYENPHNREEVREFFVSTRKGQPFCDTGDSGSFVFDGEGYLVGLLYGAQGDFSLVTDIRVVFASNREKLRLNDDAVIDVAHTF